MNGHLSRRVVFDAAFTLIHPDPPFASVYEQIAKQHGIDLPSAEIASRFTRLLREVDWHNTNEAQQVAIWRKLVGAVFHECESTAILDQLFAQLWDHFSQPTAWAVFEDVQPLWAELNRRGIPFVVGSNFDERLPEICGGMPLFSQCQKLYWSAAMGVSKPQREFYEAIASDLKLAPESLLIVGDDWQNDYLGPREADWRSVWLDRHQTNAHPQADSVHTLSDLTRYLADC